MRVAMALVLFLTAGLAALTGQTRSRTLDIYFIDVEGGTLTPEQVRTLVWTSYHQMERIHAGVVLGLFWA